EPPARPRAQPGGLDPHGRREPATSRMAARVRRTTAPAEGARATGAGRGGAAPRRPRLGAGEARPRPPPGRGAAPRGRPGDRGDRRPARDPRGHREVAALPWAHPAGGPARREGVAMTSELDALRSLADRVHPPTLAALEEVARRRTRRTAATAALGC